MKSLRAKITWSFLLLIGCSVLGTGIFLALLLKSLYFDSLTSRLVKEGETIAEVIDWKKNLQHPEDFQRQSEIYGKKLDARVTFIDQNGNVLGDSNKQKETMGNQRLFPEVEHALHNRSYNPTQIRGDFLYVALPVMRGNQVLGAISLSLGLEEINKSLQKVWYSLAGGLMIAYLLAAYASSRIASSVTRPLEEITQVAVDIAQKRIHRRVQKSGNDEIGRLGQAINRMAHSLQNQMETIRKSERRLTSVIETMESGLLMVDSTGRVNLANRAFERMFGVPATDLIGYSYRSLTYPYDLSALITECAETGKRIRKEIHLYYPAERILEVNLAPMWVETNGVGVVVVFHDLTAIKRLEQLRKDFVANVSHELKTPITSIRGFAETLLDGAMNDPDTCREFLQIINDESLRLQRLVGDILDLSHIESKKIQLKLETVSVESLVQSVVKTLEDQIRAKEQTLEVEIENSFEIRVDPDRFRQIILNLLSNAMNYTPRGGRISLYVNRDKERWMLEVADTGIGIPESDLPRIFERFYRVDKARARNSGGTGLGLAIVKHLVEVHHGEIQVNSVVGKGTTFTLTFPLTVTTND